MKDEPSAFSLSKDAPAGVERIRDHLLPLYEKYGRKDDCRIELFDCGHLEIPPMRQLVSEWFDRYLASQS